MKEQQFKPYTPKQAMLLVMDVEMSQDQDKKHQVSLHRLHPNTSKQGFATNNHFQTKFQQPQTFYSALGQVAQPFLALMNPEDILLFLFVLCLISYRG